jgi:predicted transcriptional regulator
MVRAIRGREVQTGAGMQTSPRDPAELARERQRGWYGEPLGELFRGLIADLGLNQAKLAAVLGLSAPMLSQLMSGQRAKIGNPAVVRRVQSLRELAAAVADGSVPAPEAAQRMAEIRESAGSGLLTPSSATGTTTTSAATTTALDGTATASHGTANGRPATTSGSAAPPPVSARRVVREIQQLLRSCGSAEELLGAAESVAGELPELAEFLRVYGTGRTDEAVAHFEAHQD